MDDVRQLIESVERRKQRLLQEAQERQRKAKEKKAMEPPPEKKAKPKPKKKLEKAPVGRAKKIQLYPTNEERKKLTRWFGGARWTYNRCLEEVKEKGCNRTEKALRARVVNADVLEAGDEKMVWLKEVPYDIRDEGLRDLLKAYKSNMAKRAKNDGNHTFEMHFRSKK
jgi:hypothetical protein